MKKSDERRSFTNAFVSYSRLMRNTSALTPFEVYRRIEGALGNNHKTALDLWAAHECMLMLYALNDTDTIIAVKEIYLKPFAKYPKRALKKNEISWRIRRFAAENFVDDRTVYRRLAKARNLWQKLRFFSREI